MKEEKKTPQNNGRQLDDDSLHINLKSPKAWFLIFCFLGSNRQGDFVAFQLIQETYYRLVQGTW